MSLYPLFTCHKSFIEDFNRVFQAQSLPSEAIFSKNVWGERNLSHVFHCISAGYTWLKWWCQTSNFIIRAVICFCFAALLLFSFLYFGCAPEALRILVAWSGIKSLSPVVEAQSPNHWTAREVPIFFFFFRLYLTEKNEVGIWKRLFA